MRKIRLFALIALALLIILMVGTLQDEPLTLATEKALHYRPPPVPPTENAFVALAGFNAPAGSDFIQKGEEYIRLAQQAKWSEEPAREAEILAFRASMNESKDSPSYFCLKEIQENCLTEIQADLQNIHKMLADNQELIRRYQIMQEKPIYSNPLTGRELLTIKYSDYYKVAHLLSAQALLEIRNGNVAGGLNWIEKDMDFYQKIFAAKETVLLDKMFAQAQIRRHVNFLSLLIQEDTLRDQTARVRSLLVPLGNIREKFRDVVWRERVFIQQSWSHTPLAELVDEFDSETVEMKPVYGSSKALYFFLFKRQMTQNLTDEISQHIVKVVEETPVSRLPFENIEQKAMQSAGLFNPFLTRIIKSPFFWKNHIGERYFRRAPPNLANSLLGMYDLDARIRLVRAQLEYKLTAKKPGDDPASILQGLGPETFNPYTGKPFDWKPEQGTLGFQPGNPRDKDHRVEIRLLP
jgi:hypothetical protein